MSLQLLFAVAGWSCAVGVILWWIADAIERAAQAGERIGKARHRDHSSVPAICWKDRA